MDKKLEEMLKSLDKNKFYDLSVKEKKKILLSLGDFLCTSRNIVDYSVSFGQVDLDSVGETEGTDVFLSELLDLNDYEHYILAVDAVVHECFHVFQRHLTAFSQELVGDVLWERILAYKKYDLLQRTGKSSDEQTYRFNFFEADAYRHTDLFMRTAYNYLKSQKCDCSLFKKYLSEERNNFLHASRKLNSPKQPERKANLYKSINDRAYKYFLKNYKYFVDFEKLSKAERTEIFNSGKFGSNFLTNDFEYEITDEFVATAEENFKKALPFLYPKSKTAEQVSK